MTSKGTYRTLFTKDEHVQGVTHTLSIKADVKSLTLKSYFI